MIVKTNAVVAEAEPQFGRIDVGEPCHIAFLGRKKARESVQEIDGCISVDSADFGSGLVRPDNLRSLCSLAALLVA
jgi:hypothetical protein